MSALSSALARLADIVGGDNLLTAADAVSGYSLEGQTPLAVGFPGSAEETAAVLRAASEAGLSVLVRGSGHHLYLGEPPTPIGLAVCLSRLSEIVEYDPDDLTVTAQAGVSLGKLQRAVGEHGQMLPLDPPGPETATLGGIAGANRAGPMRMRYGAPRDLTLGMRVALPSGDVIRTGGRTVKNVAGYDLGKLFIGGLGTTGAIVEVTMRLTPRPEARAVLAIALEPDRAAPVAQRLIGSRLEIAACELLDRAASDSLGARLPLTVGSESCVLLVGLLGEREGIARQDREIRGWTDGPCVLLEDDEAEAIWRAVRDLVYPGLSGRPMLRMSVPISVAAAILGSVPKRPGWVGLGRMGDGVVFALAPAEDREVVGALRELRAEAERLGGWAVLESGPVELKHELSVWGEVPNADLMRELKRACDPKGILGCGRLGGDR